MARTAIDAFTYLLDSAFRDPGIEETNESQALLPNLATVSDEVWRTLPPGGARSIESILLHVGSSKVMYDDYAFGSATLKWGTREVEPWGEGPAPHRAVVAWLDEAHTRFLDHVAALPDDSALDEPRMTNWGELRPTRWIVSAMITHDVYHAGEINHIRSILGPDDRWRYIQLGFG